MAQRNKILLAGLAAVMICGAQEPAGISLAALKLEVTGKQSIMAGEPLDLSLRLTPVSSRASAPATISVMDGSVQVFIARGYEDYLEYDAPGWGTKKTADPELVTLSAGESVNTAASIFFHDLPAQKRP